MKKTLSLLLVSVLLIGSVLILMSCGGKTLSGEYELDALFASQSYKFSGSKVTITVSAVVGNDLVYEGTYEINDDEITFTFDSEDESAKEYSGTVSFYEADDGSYIKIAGVKYKKK